MSAHDDLIAVQGLGEVNDCFINFSKQTTDFRCPIYGSLPSVSVWRNDWHHAKRDLDIDQMNVDTFGLDHRERFTITSATPLREHFEPSIGSKTLFIIPVPVIFLKADYDTYSNSL